MLYQCLTEAQQRASKDGGWPENVQARSAETVSIIMEKLAMEGLTIPQLKRMARQKAA
jgi:hypothetical protein